MFEPPARRVGRHVLLTGATGFLGTAILEALLRTTDATVTVLARASSGATAEDRIDTLLKGEAFEPLRTRLGPAGYAALSRRVRVLPGDLAALAPPFPGAVPRVRLPEDIDTVIHSASRVQFDDTWHDALTANVAGPAALYGALAELGRSPHVIHVSTAYVQAGRTRVAEERPVAHDADWRAELARAEENPRLRGDRDASRRYARSHGFTDVYTFSKALGERVAEETWAGHGHRLSIVRPAIIESALARPFPGWLDGFKVADPLIAAYAEGRMRAFPGRRRTIVDIVPVDAVTDVVLAAAARPPRSGRAEYLQVATSRVAPQRLRDLPGIVDEALGALGPQLPGTGARREMRFRSRTAIDLTLAMHRALLSAREAACGPSTATRLRRRALNRMARYAALYAPYTCTPTTFEAGAALRLLEAHRAAGHEATELRRFPWRDYLTGVHVPALGHQRHWPGCGQDAGVVPVRAQARPASGGQPQAPAAWGEEVPVAVARLMAS